MRAPSKAPAPISESPDIVTSIHIPSVEASAPVTEAALPDSETLTSGAENMQAIALAQEKEMFRAAFEGEEEACSTELAMGEQDPLVNEYVIEKAAHNAKCSIQHHDH
ncbi:hypothetical protein BGZ65_012348 [Modicella reniformis]|uniref:Uncharacterized protein n=1 Tax=Modicella reniformis TaxID=1440133 RepID=A0A9P6M7F8_9FUNG|nr:hypothetical protein BGZ65_012348 [Modicella reniformis]